MKRASITEAKNRLNALLDYVRAGDTVIIEDRGTAVAQLIPVNGTAADTDSAKIARLTRAGVINPPAADPRAVMERLLSRPPIPVKRSVVEALIEERRRSSR